MRRPGGFICPDCGNTTYCQLKTRSLFQCHRRHHQTSLTAGTLLDHTHLSLTQWLLAMYLLAQHKNGLSALHLSRELGVRSRTAWTMKHKLMQVSWERGKTTPLTGRIEMDDAYLGGERAGKRGRGARHKNTSGRRRPNHGRQTSHGDSPASRARYPQEGIGP